MVLENEITGLTDVVTFDKGKLVLFKYLYQDQGVTKLQKVISSLSPMNGDFYEYKDQKKTKSMITHALSSLGQPF